MIIKQLRIRNFGPYAGFQNFNLKPSSDGHYQRPLVLITGKNGVGKTTLLEAVRLCLHGRLALGSSVSRDEYEKHLEARIHRPAPGLQEPTEAGVAMALEYVLSGRKFHYEIRRSWKRGSSGVVEKLEVSEDYHLLDDLNADQKEAFLRELVPVCVSELFLLDNEKLDALSADASSSSLLAEMVHSLLGLDLVHRLQGDLDVYLSRSLDGSSKEFSRELEDAAAEVDRLADRLRNTEAELVDTNERLALLKGSIAHQEQRLAQEGHGFAYHLGELRRQADRLRGEIDRQRINIHELASGLLPFAVSPKYCQLIVQRLEQESQLQQSQLVRELATRAEALLAQELANPALWNGIATAPSAEASTRVAAVLRDRLLQDFACGSNGTRNLLLHASSHDKALLTSWAEDSQTNIPRQFCQATAELTRLEREMVDVEHRLAEIPSQETLAPIIRDLNSLHHRLGEIYAQKEALEEQRRKQEFEHRQSGWRLKAVRQRLDDANKGHRRVDLVLKTQRVLEQYGEQLLQHKLTLLQRAITLRFEELCRKPGFVTDVVIDPSTFALTLYRYGRPFDRASLSAGERQLLATATLWAMRDVSRLPIPVITDTPVARLDADHREAMVEQFFPRVSQQTVLLATDAEADAMIAQSLEPLLARTYDLEYNLETGGTFVHLEEPAPTPKLTPELDLVG